jgi:hypothetical protein
MRRRYPITAAYTCLLRIWCIVANVVLLFVSRSLPSNGSARYNNNRFHFLLLLLELHVDPLLTFYILNYHACNNMYWTCYFSHCKRTFPRGLVEAHNMINMWTLMCVGRQVDMSLAKIWLWHYEKRKVKLVPAKFTCVLIRSMQTGKTKPFYPVVRKHYINLALRIEF